MTGFDFELREKWKFQSFDVKDANLSLTNFKLLLIISKVKRYLEV